MATASGVVKRASTRSVLARRAGGSHEQATFALTKDQPPQRAFVINGKPMEQLVAATLTPKHMYSSIARGFLEELRSVLSSACGPRSAAGYTTRGNLAKAIGLPEDRIDRWLATGSTVVPSFAQVIDLLTVEPGLSSRHKRRLVAFIAREAGCDVCDLVARDDKPVEAQLNEVMSELGDMAKLLGDARAAASQKGQQLSIKERREMQNALADVVREAQELQVTLAVSAEEAIAARQEEVRLGKHIDRRGSVMADVPFWMAVVVLFVATGLYGNFTQATLWFAIVTLFVVLNAKAISEIGRMLDAMNAVGAIRLGNQ